MSRKIQFYYLGVSHQFKEIKKLKSKLIQIFEDEGLSLQELTFVLCSDDFLLEMNNKYLGHDTYTDILTFDLSEPGSNVIGEIYISLDRVAENSTRFDVLLKGELLRVMIHGILHLCGYKDHSEEEVTQMREKERFYLSRF